jgi:hypothetical protein
MPSSPQRWAWVPQLSQATLRVSPAVHVQSSGASHGAQLPITQRSSPGAHAPRQLRCAVVPTSGSPSSQSLPAAIASPSASSSGAMQRPSRQIC